jgi:hypothetical protein
MAWNKALPGDAEKIRKLGEVIRPNWEAIEEGDDVGVSSMLQMRSVQLDNRTGLAANNDPQTNAGTHYLYSKDDGSGTQEAFMKDSAGNVLQITSGGKVGSTSLEYEAESITFDQNIEFNENNMVTAWGFFNNSGIFQYGSGLKTSTGTPNPSTAKYEIEFDGTRVNNTNYGIFGMVTTSSEWVIQDPAFAKTTSQFRIRLATSGTPTNGSFYIFVVGGQ